MVNELPARHGDRVIVAMPPEVASAVREAASRMGTSVSDWLVMAARQQIRGDAFSVALGARDTADDLFSDEGLCDPVIRETGSAVRGVALDC